MCNCYSELYKKVWLRLNTVLPRSLWALTIKALQHNNGASALKEENLMQDPLQVLQCDDRVYRYEINNVLYDFSKYYLIAFLDVRQF